MMLKFSPLHQFALTVNCVKNNSDCCAARPGLGFRQIGHDGKGHQPRNCAAKENTEQVQGIAKIIALPATGTEQENNIVYCMETSTLFINFAQEALAKKCRTN